MVQACCQEMQRLTERRALRGLSAQLEQTRSYPDNKPIGPRLFFRSVDVEDEETLRRHTEDFPDDLAVGVEYVLNMRYCPFCGRDLEQQPVSPPQRHG